MLGASTSCKVIQIYYPCGLNATSITLAEDAFIRYNLDDTASQKHFRYQVCKPARETCLTSPPTSTIRYMILPYHACTVTPHNIRLSSYVFARSHSCRPPYRTAPFRDGGLGNALAQCRVEAGPRLFDPAEERGRHRVRLTNECSGDVCESCANLR